MRVRLEYGKTGLDAEIPDQHVVRSLAYKQADPIPDPDAELHRLLKDPIGSASLAEIAAGRKGACILICDITRW